MRAGLRLLLERIADFQVIGEAGDGREAVRLAQQLDPDVAVLDIAMPLLNGLEAAAQIHRTNERTGLVILSMHADESYIAKALDAGAKGYLLKETADDYLEAAIRSVALSRPYFSPEVAQAIVSEYVRMLRERKVEDSYELLTEREREVLQLLAEGHSNKEAAAILNLSPYTIETHRTNLMQKLNLHNTADLVLFAVKKGIIAP